MEQICEFCLGLMRWNRRTKLSYGREFFFTCEENNSFDFVRQDIFNIAKVNAFRTVFILKQIGEKTLSSKKNLEKYFVLFKYQIYLARNFCFKK